MSANPADRRLANLRPFQKGQSGNPSGRMKIPEDVKEMARGLTKEAIGTLASVMRDPAAPHASRVRAAETLLDRAWGKPETSAHIRVSQDVRDLSTAEILVALANLGITGGESGESGSVTLRLAHDDDDAGELVDVTPDEGRRNG